MKRTSLLFAIGLVAAAGCGAELPGDAAADGGGPAGVTETQQALTPACSATNPQVNVCAWEGGDCNYGDAPAAHEILVLHTTAGNPFDLRCRKLSAENLNSIYINNLSSVTPGSDNTISWFKSGSDVKAQLWSGNNETGALCNIQTGLVGTWRRIKTETYQGNTFNAEWCQGAGLGVSNDGVSSLQVAKLGYAYQH